MCLRLRVQAIKVGGFKVSISAFKMKYKALFRVFVCL
jgi:hypothetical protein